MPSYLAKMTQSTTKAHLYYFLKYHSGERKRETHLSVVDCWPGPTFRTLDTAFGRGEEISWENVKVSLLIIELSHLGLVGSIKFVKHVLVSNRTSWVDFPRKHQRHTERWGCCFSEMRQQWRALLWRLSCSQAPLWDVCSLSEVISREQSHC